MIGFSSRRLARAAWLSCAVALAFELISTPAHAADGAHVDPVSRVVLMLAVLLLAAKVGGELATRLGQPAVLGELLAGVLLGNLDLMGFASVEAIATDPMIDMLARLGVIVLLFEVGLESTVNQMMKVGLSAFLVAVIGVVVPSVLGWLAARWLVPDASPYAHVFVGATLCATSVGITARVFQDLNVAKTTEARIVLGAAVIDDVLGLVVLAVVAGIIAAADSGTSLSYLDIFLTIAKAAGFLFGALAIGARVAPQLFRLASHLKSRGVLLAVSLAFCFLLSWAAGAIGLAPIVGAFAAGLVLEHVHYRDFTERGEHELEELIRPISALLVPVFFMVMGMRTDLSAFMQPGVLGLAAALTVAAILGKQACGLAVVERGIDRLTVGIGMVPRGEVGLIFANLGLGLKVGGKSIVDNATYSAIVAMVVITTLITPPALRLSLNRGKRAATTSP
ncbi:MAG TPA: cation:proton antiporter [Polyangiaceae bacterium]|nr:cation:proton antiporter [Polyangiaceae bacterium]